MAVSYQESIQEEDEKLLPGVSMPATQPFLHLAQ
jgi:hypothetical protein